MIYVKVKAHLRGMPRLQEWELDYKSLRATKSRVVQYRDDVYIVSI